MAEIAFAWLGDFFVFVELQLPVDLLDAPFA